MTHYWQKELRMSKQIPARRETWHSPALRDLGQVGDVLQFPGEGKLSMVADDMGDVQRKPKGLEEK